MHIFSLSAINISSQILSY